MNDPEPVPVTREWIKRQPPQCTFLGCTTKPVYQLDPPNGGRSWFSCRKHKAGHEKALSIGYASDLGATVRPLGRISAS